MKRKLIIFTISVIFIMTMLNFSAFAAPAKPQLLNDPIDGQILPYYDVWLRWIDNTDEAITP